MTFFLESGHSHVEFKQFQIITDFFLLPYRQVGQNINYFSILCLYGHVF